MQNIHNYHSASMKVREATALVAEALEKAECPAGAQEIYEYIEHNEAGLALEILCENLYEFSCPVPLKAYKLLEEAGQLMEIDSNYWEMLKPLVSSQ